MWKVVKLGDICILNYGKALDKKDRSENAAIPVYGANGIKAYTDKLLHDKPSIIIGRKGSAGELNKVTKPFWALDVTYYVTTDQSIVDLDFLFYALATLNLPSMARGVKPGINRNDVYDRSINLPPLAEQQRIVAKLNAAFAEIDEAINAAEAKETEVQKLKTSLLSSSLNGDAVMWKTVKLGDMLEVQNGYAFNSKQFDVDGDMPLIRIRDLKNAFETETCYTGEYDDKYIVQSGDLLIGMDGEFRCYEWQGGAALLNQRVCKLQNFHAGLDQRFLLYAINSELKKIEDVTGFTTVKHLSSNTIKQIELSIPSLAEQQRIVAKLDAANSEFRNVNESIAKSKVNYLALKSAILEQKLQLSEAA